MQYDRRSAFTTAAMAAGAFAVGCLHPLAVTIALAIRASGRGAAVSRHTAQNDADTQRRTSHVDGRPTRQLARCRATPRSLRMGPRTVTAVSSGDDRRETSRLMGIGDAG